MDVTASLNGLQLLKNITMTLDKNSLAKLDRMTEASFKHSSKKRLAAVMNLYLHPSGIFFDAALLSLI